MSENKEQKDIELLVIKLFNELGRRVSKKDIDRCEYLPSYNTCMRRGLRLIDLNNQLLKAQYNANPRVCKECSKPIDYKRRINEFCSHSCSATFSNRGRVRDSKAEDFDLNLARRRRYKLDKDGSFVKSCCLNCGMIIAESTGKIKRKYCSLQCLQDYEFTLKFLDWYVLGKYFDNKSLRNFLEVWQGYYCSECGISEWNGKYITLEVEHIDGNSSNSDKNNVCFLCPNCHSQTPTYKGKNRGNGRHSRRQRYREGKSY